MNTIEMSHVNSMMNQYDEHNHSTKNSVALQQCNKLSTANNAKNATIESITANKPYPNRFMT